MRMLTLAVLAVAMLALPARAEQLSVMVSVPPQKHVVERIAGDLARVDVMVQPGMDAHTFEPKPSQMAQASRASLYFAQGVDFERAWLPRLSRTNPGLVVVDTLAGLELIPLADEDHGRMHAAKAHKKEDHGHKEAGKNAHEDMRAAPHTWTSPAMVKRQAVLIAEALVKADPANEPVYRANLAAFQAELDALDARIRQILSGVPAGSEFLVFHPAWAYFARDYGLKETAIESGGKEPSPRELKAIIERARQAGARAVFVQPQFSRKTAQTVADALGARLVEADDLAPDWADNLVRVAEALALALKGQPGNP